MSHRPISTDLAAGLKAGVAVFVVGCIALAANHGGAPRLADIVADSPSTALTAPADPYYYLPSEFVEAPGEGEPHIEAF